MNTFGPLLSPRTPNGGTVLTRFLLLGCFVATLAAAHGDEVQAIRALLDDGKYGEAYQTASNIAGNDSPTSAPSHRALAIQGLRARAQHELGMYDEARAAFEDLVHDLDTAAVDPGAAPVYAEILMDLARTYDELFMYQEAQTVLDQAEKLIAKVEPANDLLWAHHCFCRADHTWWRPLANEISRNELPKDKTEGRPLAEEALALRHKLAGGRHGDVIRSHLQVGGFALADDELALATSHIFAALALAEKELPLNHPLLAQVYSDLADLQSHFPDAGLRQQELYQLRCLLIESEAFGQNHSYYINNHAFLGQTKLDQGQYRESKRWFQKGLDLLSKKAASRDVSYARQTHLRGLAKAHIATEDFDSGIEALRNALDIVEEQFGADTLLGIRIRGELAECELESGEVARAKRGFEAALQALAKARPNGDALAASLYQGVARSLYTQDDMEGAIGNHLKGLAETKKHLGNESLPAGQQYHDLGLLLQAAKKFPEAMDAMETALQIFRRHDTEGSDRLRETRLDIAQLALMQSDFGKTRRLLEEQLEIDQKTLGNSNARTAESKVALGLLLLKQFREPLKAELLLEQAVRFYEQQFQDEETKTLLAGALEGLEAALRIRARDVQNRAEQLKPDDSPSSDETSAVDEPDPSGFLHSSTVEAT